MNHKIKFLKRITLFLCILMLSANCASDDNLEKPGGNSTAKLKETQKWFNKYESDGENYFLLDNLQYNWDEAKITNSEDGTETTIVPIIESKKDNREFWEQRLYIYKTGKEDYKALVYEIATNKYVPLSSQSIDGGEFTGFISVWDLKTGFVRAARFENNQVIETGVVEVIDYTKRNSTNKAPIEAPCVYADFGDGGCGGKGGSDNSTPNLPGTVLREVTVNAPSTGSPVEYYGPRGPVIGGSDTGGYTSPNGGGASSGGSGQATSIIINIEGQKVDPKEETKCFDKTKPAVLTIYVQQPNENTRDKMGENSVGHTFIGIQQGTIQRLLGFYPDSPNASLISSQNSELHDNSSTLYHVSISVEVDAAKLANVINYINNYSKTYDLNNYNCSDFAIGAAEKGGLNLPKTTGAYNAVIVNFKGRNPGDLGQDIRNMSTPNGVSKNITRGNAPKKKGGC